MSYGPSMQRSSLLGQAAATIVGQAAACLAQKNKSCCVSACGLPSGLVSEATASKQSKIPTRPTNHNQDQAIQINRGNLAMETLLGGGGGGRDFRRRSRATTTGAQLRLGQASGPSPI